MSSTTGLVLGAHPITAFASDLHASLDAVAPAPAWSMTPEEQAASLRELHRAEVRLHALRLRVLAAADAADVAATTAATSTTAWLAHATTRARPEVHREVVLAQALDSPAFTPTTEALSEGRIDVGQAAVIVRAVADLPVEASSADPSLAERAQKHLLHLADDHDAVALRRLARHLHHVLDPDAADAAEGERLAAEEEAAARSCSLTLSDNGDGTHSGRFRIPTLHAAMLRKAIEAFTSSSKVDPARRQQTPRPALLGEAFCQVLERLPDDLATSGGRSATVVVTLDHDRLLHRLGTAALDTGHTLSAGEARRLACESGLVPAVLARALGGASVVLDLGRRTRLHTAKQRLAMAVRDGGCTADGCDRPPAWCHAHHDEPWSEGGPTSFAAGRLLCPFHHRRAHDHRYDMARLASGKVTFHRRT